MSVRQKAIVILVVLFSGMLLISFLQYLDYQRYQSILEIFKKPVEEQNWGETFPSWNPFHKNKKPIDPPIRFVYMYIDGKVDLLYGPPSKDNKDNVEDYMDVWFLRQHLFPDRKRNETTIHTHWLSYHGRSLIMECDSKDPKCKGKN